MALYTLPLLCFISYSESEPLVTQFVQVSQTWLSPKVYTLVRYMASIKIDGCMQIPFYHVHTVQGQQNLTEAIREGELLFDNRTPATAFQLLDHSQTWSRRRPSTSQSRAPPLPGRQSIQSRSKSLRWGISFRNPLQRSVHPLPLIWQIKVSYVPSSKEKSTLTRRRTSRGVRSCNRSSPPLRSPLTLWGRNTSSSESTCCFLFVPQKTGNATFSSFSFCSLSKTVE